jgi:hypothetical protein
MGLRKSTPRGDFTVVVEILDAVQHVKKTVASASRNPSYFAKASHVFFTIILGSVRKRKLMDARGYTMGLNISHHRRRSHGDV